VARAAQLETVERTIVLGPEYEQWLGQARPVPPQLEQDEWDPAQILYTAGTTGGPKGVLRPHRCHSLMSLVMPAELGCFTVDDRQLAISPFFHGMGSGWAICSMLNGGYCAIAQVFHPEIALELVVTHRITSTIMAPTHLK